MRISAQICVEEYCANAPDYGGVLKFQLCVNSGTNCSSEFEVLYENKCEPDWQSIPFLASNGAIFDTSEANPVFHLPISEETETETYFGLVNNEQTCGEVMITQVDF